jgi:hypothetical protein
MYTNGWDAQPSEDQTLTPRLYPIPGQPSHPLGTLLVHPSIPRVHSCDGQEVQQDFGGTAVGGAPGGVRPLLKVPSVSPAVAGQPWPSSAHKPRPPRRGPRQVCAQAGGGRWSGAGRRARHNTLGTARTKAHSAAVPRPLPPAPRGPGPALQPALASVVGVCHGWVPFPHPTPTRGAVPGGRRAGAGLSDGGAGIRGARISGQGAIGALKSGTVPGSCHTRGGGLA